MINLRKYSFVLPFAGGFAIAAAGILALQPASALPALTGTPATVSHQAR